MASRGRLCARARDADATVETDKQRNAHGAKPRMTNGVVWRTDTQLAIDTGTL